MHGLMGMSSVSFIYKYRNEKELLLPYQFTICITVGKGLRFTKEARKSALVYMSSLWRLVNEILN